MSVIITGMTIPNNCNDCGIVAEKAKTTCKSNGCPLKSVDGLIQKLKAYKNQQGDIWGKSIVQGAIDITKEYCEVEE